MTTQEPTKRINLHISGHNKNKKYELKNVHAVDVLDLPMQTLNQDYLQVNNPQARFKVKAYTNAVPRILIGLEDLSYADFNPTHLRFNVKYQRIKEDVPTKRQFLSLIMSTFDPIWFLSCFTITGKLLLRDIWQKNVSWDEQQLNSAFQKWRHQLEGVRLLRCPRHYFGSEMVKSILTDASKSAYAALAYWRATYQNRDVQVSFVSGKSKCAPMRTMSVPRPLPAGAWYTLINAVKSRHCMETEDAILWTDAKTVLRWICSTHRRYKEFVGNRRFSEYNRLLRTMNWVLRFVCRCRRQQREHGKYGLTAAESEEAELVLVRVAQWEAFPDELHRLYANRPALPTSELKGLLPYLDDLAILRGSGRIDAALCLPYGARRPIIFTHGHPLKDLIVRHYHVKMKHQIVNATISEIRMKFWITK
ncbi:uncharacterized protein, partial [Drosophila tropicalis]|uniref:uncharacterized protein n=1 Tax=Drosophila tropicalis TaxID=46794 RepID=UPI0035AC1B9C